MDDYNFTEGEDNFYCEPKKPKKSRGYMSAPYEWLDAIAFSLICVILVFTFLFRVVGIKGESMTNTLQDSERVIITNLFYTPKQGDIVVISRNYQNENGDQNRDDQPIIKRVIATEGQTVTFDPTNGTVAVDGKVLQEDYVRDNQKTYMPSSPFDVYSEKVKKGHIFVMGDNRGDSLDSRYPQIGQVDTRYVLGHAVLRIYPINKIKKL